MKFVQVRVKIGEVWMPVQRGVVSEERGKEIAKAYKITRPHAEVKLFPEDQYANIGKA